MSSIIKCVNDLELKLNKLNERKVLINNLEKINSIINKNNNIFGEKVIKSENKCLKFCKTNAEKDINNRKNKIVEKFHSNDREFICDWNECNKTFKTRVTNSKNFIP